MSNSWASDAPISLPQPLAQDNPGLVPMFGFVFTEFGLFHDVSTAQHEDLNQPTFGPAFDPVQAIAGDQEFRDG